MYVNILRTAKMLRFWGEKLSTCAARRSSARGKRVSHLKLFELFQSQFLFLFFFFLLFAPISFHLKRKQRAMRTKRAGETNRVVNSEGVQRMRQNCGGWIKTNRRWAPRCAPHSPAVLIEYKIIYGPVDVSVRSWLFAEFLPSSLSPAALHSNRVRAKCSGLSDFRRANVIRLVPGKIWNANVWRVRRIFSFFFFFFF